MSDTPSFEQALSELEEVVSRLEEGELPLDEALSCFEAGVRNAQRCRELLAQVEGRVELLLKDADGNLSREPMPGSDVSGDE